MIIDIVDVGDKVGFVSSATDSHVMTMGPCCSEQVVGIVVSPHAGILCIVVTVLIAQSEILGNSIADTLSARCTITPVEEHIVLGTQGL